jgi:hypothetical protein
VRLVEEAEDEPIRRPQRGYIRSVVGIDWEDSRRRGGNDDGQEEEEEENDWQQTLNVTCSASNTIGRQTHTDTRMFNLERVRPGDVKGTPTNNNYVLCLPPMAMTTWLKKEFHFIYFFCRWAATGEQDDEVNDNQAGAGYCGRYTGNICRGQLSNPASVWYNISSNDQTGGWLNEQLVHGLWEEVVNTLREPCKSAAKVYSPPGSRNMLTWLIE